MGKNSLVIYSMMFPRAADDKSPGSPGGQNRVAATGRGRHEQFGQPYLGLVAVGPLRLKGVVLWHYTPGGSRRLASATASMARRSSICWSSSRVPGGPVFG
jgi:hypothetical protein